MLILTSFDNLAITYVKRLPQKFHFSIETVLNSLQTQKGLELVFRSQFLNNFLIQIFLL